MLQNRLACLEEGLPQDYDYTNNDLTFISAKVINLKTTKKHNYLTLNKGERDGLSEDLGVFNKDGAVGIITATSNKFSVVMPLINTDIHLSCKLLRQNHIGSLTWDGRDRRFAYLEDVAKHIEVAKGDTIVTSGYTVNFPENIPVGIVEDVQTTESDAYHKIKIKFAVNYNSLGDVIIIKNNTAQEQEQLEDSIK